MQAEPFISASRDIYSWNDTETLTHTDQMQLADIRYYMSDGILTKVDRASMSVGLEVRVPLLSEPIFDFAMSIPERAKRTKTGMRDLQKTLAYRYVPRRLLDDPKMGFGFPIDIWLRSSLRDWASDLLSISSLNQVPYLQRDKILRAWEWHLSGRSDEHWRLWPVLMYVQWYRRWVSHINLPLSGI